MFAAHKLARPADDMRIAKASVLANSAPRLLDVAIPGSFRVVPGRLNRPSSLRTYLVIGALLL